MTQYLVAIHHPDDYDPSVAEDEAMSRAIDALNDEMKAAGVRIFVGGLRSASSARSLRAQPDGEVLITDGPYLETKEHVGGFWVLEAADLDEALAWGRKAAVACRAPVEVRPFHRRRDGKEMNKMKALTHARRISTSSKEIFKAFQDQAMLSKWYGPDGFTTTSHSFEFKPGGKWVFVMHGPDGTNYPNEMIFQEIVEPNKIVMRHSVQPYFTATVTIEDVRKSTGC